MADLSAGAPEVWAKSASKRSKLRKKAHLVLPLPSLGPAGTNNYENLAQVHPIYDWCIHSLHRVWYHQKSPTFCIPLPTHIIQLLPRSVYYIHKFIFTKLTTPCLKAHVLQSMCFPASYREGLTTPATSGTIHRASSIALVGKVVGHHLLLNIISNIFTVGTGRKCWCDQGRRGWSHRSLTTPSVGIFYRSSVESGGLPSISQQFHSWNRPECMLWSGHEGLITPATSCTICWHLVL